MDECELAQMAIDTEDKRASTLGSGLECLTVLPAPDDDVDALDRSQVAGFYAMSSDEPGAPSTGAVASGFFLFLD